MKYVQFWTKINLVFFIPEVETPQPILPYAKRGTGVYGGTKFADLTAEEFKERHLGLYTKVKLHAVSDYKKRWSEVSAGVS